MNHHSELLERVCSLIMAFCFGAVMVVFYLWQDPQTGFRGPLTVLVPWIQVTVFVGGVILLLLAGLQFWQLLVGGESQHLHEHVLDPALPVSSAGHQPYRHDHHAHGHAHAEHSHEHHDCEHHHHHHHHCHEAAHSADVQQGHGPTTHHHHDHAHAHDHGWSPVKYVPLVVPLLLSVMGMPSDRQIQAFSQDLVQAQTRGYASYSGVLLDPADLLNVAAVTSASWPGNALASGLLNAVGIYCASQELDPGTPPQVTDLATLERIANSPVQRETWQRYPHVEVAGEFHSAREQPGSGRTIFYVVQLRMACCLGDAKHVIMICATRLPLNYQEGQWIAVRGKLDFLQMQDGWRPLMRVWKIEPRPKPARPYLTQ